MRHHVHMTILLLLLVVEEVCVARVTFVQNIYKKTEPEQNITGKIGGELIVESKIECSIKCRGMKKCVAYQYRGTEAGNCLLIQPNCSSIDGQMFEQEQHDIVFEKVNLIDSSKWTEPRCWVGPEAALYQSFDGSDGLVLMESSQEVNQIPLVTGKMGRAWALNGTRNQWVDLGIHTEACMTRPGTCGAAGGAISFWLNVIDCSGGIISSYSIGSFTSSMVVCLGTDVAYDTFPCFLCVPKSKPIQPLYLSKRLDNLAYLFFRISFSLPDGFFYLDHPRPKGWTHFTLNYIGSEDEQEVSMYYDAEEVASITNKYEASHLTGDGRIVVGRWYTDRDEHYVSVQVDELIFFNKALSSTDIRMLYNGAL